MELRGCETGQRKTGFPEGGSSGPVKFGLYGGGPISKKIISNPAQTQQVSWVVKALPVSSDQPRGVREGRQHT